MHDTHLALNISNALQQLESVKAAVDQSNDPKLKVSKQHSFDYKVILTNPKAVMK